jgi:hypothetical protein
MSSEYKHITTVFQVITTKEGEIIIDRKGIPIRDQDYVSLA